MKPTDFARELSVLTDAREPFAVATVVGVEGSSEGKPGFKAIISKEGRIVYGTIGGSCPESAISPIALDVMRTNRPRVIKVYLEDAKAPDATVTSSSEDEIHIETNCGGVMQIYVESYLPTDRLVIIASGGREGLVDGLIRLGKYVGFEVILIDAAPASEEDPDRIITDTDYDLTKFVFSASDSVVILTHSAKDVPILTYLSTQNVRYVGMIGSMARARGELNFLIKRGVAKEFVESIKCPVGTDIGAKTSQEIAVSIVSEIIATKHGKMLPRKSAIGT